MGPIAKVFDLISSEYNWDDEVILDKSLRRLRQIVAAISARKYENERLERLKLSWQTRSLGMIIAASAKNANEDLMSFAANLTIDNEEYAKFNKEETAVVTQKNKLPVHATTQEEATQQNYERAADRNNFDMLALFGQGMSTAPPGQ